MGRSSARLALAVVVAVSSSAMRSTATATDPGILAGLYHEGVKAFYHGATADALDRFGGAIEAGTNDPRCFYYHGLTLLRQGRNDAAEQAFAQGAKLEAANLTDFYNVSAALERVQGAERRLLERHRAAGRKNALAEIDRIRFEKFRRFDPAEAIATPVGAPSDAAAPSAPAASQPAAMSDPNAAPNPFGGAAPATAPAATPGAPAPNPFGAPAAPAAAPATPAPATPAPGANPFGT